MEALRMNENSKELQDYGVMTQPFASNAPVYDFRKLLAYCKEKNVKPETLSESEYKMFRLN